MNECTRTKTKTVNLGRLPVYVGNFGDEMDPDIGYHKYNIVSYMGSSFINLVEGNKKEPVKIVYDTSGNFESYTLNDGTGEWTGWYFVANALDARYWAEQCERRFVDNFFTLEFEQSTGNFIGHYGFGGNIKKIDTNYNPNPEQENCKPGDMYMEYDDTLYGIITEP